MEALLFCIHTELVVHGFMLVYQLLLSKGGSQLKGRNINERFVF